MIVGVAGHVDHGKSALVRSLTGVDTDRLKEEKARDISIDLGFAYLPTNNGDIIGFVDAPGHHRFMRNMIAGAAGIDVLMLVVAADDGVMPQTREHLAIAELLGIKKYLVALTKTDLVPDDWRGAMAAEVQELLAETGFAAAPVLSVSSLTGDGIDGLRKELLCMAPAAKPRAAKGRFRLAVDRCFTISGAGTIVTGPVMSGSVSVGDIVMVSPAGFSARIRAIHAQNRPAETGRCGERCALNLTGDGITRESIGRGDMIVDPALHAPADRIDCRFNLLASEARPLQHWTPLRVYHAAVEVSARAALLQDEAVQPGAQGRIQLVLEQPIAAAVGDAFVIRDTSGVRTMGGGRFIDLRGPQRRRRAADRLEQLCAMEVDAHADRLRALLKVKPYYISRVEFARDHALSESAYSDLLKDTPHTLLGSDIVISKRTWHKLCENARSALTAFHEKQPEQPGAPAACLIAGFDLKLSKEVSLKVIDALVEAGVVVAQGGAFRLPEHESKLGGKDEISWARMLPRLKGEGRFRPPRVIEWAEMVRVSESDIRRILKTKSRQGEVVEVVTDHFYLRDSINEIASILGELGHAAPDGFFSAAQLRDRLANGRKLSIQLLEYFDRQGVTFRRGDMRRIDAQRLEQAMSSAFVKSTSV
ncbi:selenocysteine-specific translation elongation factor [Marinicaulis aureus]|uniref:Selenocysteine-specific elongation factor n=1 Tax=Hyphococcus aureus TaxID=2666033 RepID=A0ABW1KYM1_9PROT